MLPPAQGRTESLSPRHSGPGQGKETQKETEVLKTLRRKQSQEADAGTKPTLVPVGALNLLKTGATNVLFPATRSVLIALRTPAYEQRLACREEFEMALLHGVPIVVVDAMSTAMVSAPSHLPFSAMPTVRIADGNTHRVVSAALREHLRLLLMEAIAKEKAVDLDAQQVRVWPRFPCLAAMTSGLSTNQYWLVPQSHVFEAELQATRDLLASLKSSIKLEVLETFRPGSPAAESSIST